MTLQMQLAVHIGLSVSRSLLPRSVEKRPRKLRLEIEIE